MRIAQIIFPGASEYERKCQRVDYAALSGTHEIVVTTVDDVTADVAHVYATGELPAAPFLHFPVPYVSSADVRRSRWPFRKPQEPDYVVSPLIEKIEQSRYQPLAEAVEEAYFGEGGWELGVGGRQSRVIGSFAREGVHSVVEQTAARITRFREDVTWHLFEQVPKPQDLAGVDLWVDPAVEESDFDGFVAEALVVGVPVVASRTKINTMRLEHGRTGFLVPPRDANEMTHAILAALFKPEVAGIKLNAARQTVSKFRAKQRLRVLAHMYETLVE